MSKIIVIVGPTGVGKTKLSIELAKKLDAEIIGADAMQVYKEMNIGTAKINDMRGITHHMISIKSVLDNYSVCDYQKDGRKILDGLMSKNKNVIIAGGTGLYIKALLYDYNFNVENTFNNYDDFSNEELLNKIKNINSNIDIHINNRKRLVRMLNKLENNSKVNNNGNSLLYSNIYFIGLTTSRELLYSRINNRVEEMFDEGLLNEVKELYNNNINTNSIRTAIGYKELYEYFKGNITLDESIDLIKKNSRHYAKRQYTWFNNQMNIKWFDVDFNDFNKTIKSVEVYIG